jgi:hypothetical protein
MKRIHLFEFMDLRWFPDFLRQIQTNILQVMMTRTKAFDYAIPYIERELVHTQTDTIIDLCSGASGPWLRLINKMNDKKIKVILTDKYPNKRMFQQIKQQSGGRIDFVSEPVDAVDIPTEIKGIKTMFTGFHHFKPEEVRKFFLNARDKNQTICIFDYVPNKILTILLFPLTFIISFIQFYFLSFFVKPLSLVRLLFTNIIPVVPLVAAWDGFVSGIRKYGKNELNEIADDITNDSYRITTGEDFSMSKATPMVYLIGSPVEHIKERK